MQNEYVLRARRIISIRLQQDTPNCVNFISLKDENGAPLGPYHEGCTAGRDCYDLQMTNRRHMDQEFLICMGTPGGCARELLVNAHSANSNVVSKVDGYLYGTGSNLYGELGLGSIGEVLTFTKTNKYGPWKSISGETSGSYGSRTYAVKESGELFAAGKNSLGLLLSVCADTTNKLTFAQLGEDTDWKKVKCGDGFAVVQKTDDTLWANGMNFLCQTGLPYDCYPYEYIQLQNINGYATGITHNIVQLKTGWHALALTSEGVLWGWGRNYWGQLGLHNVIGSTNQIYGPVILNKHGSHWDMGTVSFIATGTDSSYVINSIGEMFVAGRNTNGQLGQGDTNHLARFTKDDSGIIWRGVWSDVNSYSVIAQATNGDVYVAGDNTYGQLGTGDQVQKTSWTFIGTFPLIIHGHASFRNTFFITENGEMYAAGTTITTGLGNTGSSYTLVHTKVSGNDWKFVHSGCDAYYVTAAIKNNGDIYMCGSNWNGNLGNGILYSEMQAQWDFVKVNGFSGAKEAICFIDHIYVLKEDGTLWGWGGGSDDGTGWNGMEYPESLLPFALSGGMTDGSDIAIGQYGANGPSPLLCIRQNGSISVMGMDTELTPNSSKNGQLIDPFEELKFPDMSNLSVVDYGCTAKGTMIVKHTGELFAIGENTNGCLGTGLANNYVHTQWTRVQNYNTVVKVWCGYNYSFFLLSDGSLYAVGQNNCGQLGTYVANPGAPVSPTTNKLIPVLIPVPDGEEVENIFPCSTHTLMLTKTGKVYGTGSNIFGELGLVDNYYVSFTLISVTKVNNVSVLGESSIVSLVSDGSLWGTGYTKDFGMYDGVNLTINEFDKIPNICDETCYSYFEMIGSYGGHHSIAIDKSGDIWTCGRSYEGQLGIGTDPPIQVNEFRQVTNSKDFKFVALGAAGSWAIKNNGLVYVCGDNYHGSVGNLSVNPSGTDIFEFTLAHPDPIFKQIACNPSDYSTLALTNSGTLLATGDNLYCQLGIGDTYGAGYPANPAYGFANCVVIGTYPNFVKVVSGAQVSFALTDDGKIYAAGMNSLYGIGSNPGADYGNLGTKPPYKWKYIPFIAPAPQLWKDISAAQYNVAAIALDGTLWGWGQNYYNNTGLPLNSSYYEPNQIGTDNDWIAVYMSLYRLYALKADGRIFISNSQQPGNYPSGELKYSGRGSWIELPEYYPKNIKSIAVNYAALYILTDDGKLWVYGTNTYNCLGVIPYPNVTGEYITHYCMPNLNLEHHGNSSSNGSVIRRVEDGALLVAGVITSPLSPVQSFVLWNEGKNIVFSGWGLYSLLAVDIYGDLWLKGLNGYGQFGNGTTTQFNNLTKSNVSHVSKVWTYNTRSFLLKQSGVLYAAGVNSTSGVLGVGTTTYQYLTFTKVESNGKIWFDLADIGSYNLVFALCTDGTLWGWGNSTGTLAGILAASNSIKTTPVQIGTGRNWVKIWARMGAVIVKRIDGLILVAGENTSGRLGLGHNNNVKWPWEELPEIDWKDFAIDWDSILAIKEDGTLWACGENIHKVFGMGVNQGDTNIFIKVNNDTDWDAVVAGDYCFLARKTNGTWWGAGFNSTFQLGLPIDQKDYDTWTQIPNLKA